MNPEESNIPGEVPHFHDHAPSHVQRGPLFVVVVASVVIHLIIGIICGIVVVVGKFVEPPKAEFVEPPTVVEQPQEIKQEVKKRTRAAARVAPKRLITSKAPSTLVIPMPEIRTNVQGKIGGTGTSAIGTLDGEIGGEGLGSFFGSAVGLNSDLRGTYYDLKLKKDGTPSEINQKDEFKRFVNGWVQSFNKERLSKFFQAPTQLYATHFWIPPRRAEEAPNAFGVGDKCKGNMWIALYEGQIEAPESGDYRFWGAGDDYMVVRVDGRNVLDASFNYLHPAEKSRDEKNNYPMSGDGYLWDGKKIRMEKGRKYKLEIFLAEGEGGKMSFFLQIEKVGVKYKKFRDGRPILPVFTVRDLTDEAKKRIMSDDFEKSNLAPRTVDGPVFQAK